MRLLLVILAALALAGPAAAGGGDYVIVDATPEQETTIRSALEASRFDWGLVPAQVTFYVDDRVEGAYAVADPGRIWVHPDTLLMGRASWGIIQHEYAHQVDFFLLDDAQRAEALAMFVRQQWRNPTSRFLSGNEIFASSIAWTFWRDPQNLMSFEAHGNWVAFQRLLARWGLSSAPTCKRVKVKRGFWHKHGKRRHWHKPLYRTVCS